MFLVDRYNFQLKIEQSYLVTSYNRKHCTAGYTATHLSLCIHHDCISPKGSNRIKLSVFVRVLINNAQGSRP